MPSRISASSLDAWVCRAVPAASGWGTREPDRNRTEGRDLRREFWETRWAVTPAPPASQVRFLSTAPLHVSAGQDQRLAPTRASQVRVLPGTPLHSSRAGRARRPTKPLTLGSTPRWAATSHAGDRGRNPTSVSRKLRAPRPPAIGSAPDRGRPSGRWNLAGQRRGAIPNAGRTGRPQVGSSPSGPGLARDGWSP